MHTQKERRRGAIRSSNVGEGRDRFGGSDQVVILHRRLVAASLLSKVARERRTTGLLPPDGGWGPGENQ